METTSEKLEALRKVLPKTSEDDLRNVILKNMKSGPPDHVAGMWNSQQWSSERAQEIGDADYSDRALPEYRTGFLKALARRGLDQDERRALATGADPSGGYLVPTEFDRRILQTLDEKVVLRQLGTMIVTAADRDLPVATAHGTASWVSEEGPFQESDETFGSVSLRAFKAGTLMRVSDELLQDSAVALEQYIMAEYTRRLAVLEEEAFITGDGAAKPQGVIGRATLGVTGGSATAVTGDELIELVHAVPRPYRANASWLMHDDTLMKLRALKSGDGQFLFQPGLQAAEPSRLLGVPVYTSSYMPEMASDAKSILFGDFSYYYIAIRGGTVFQRLNELYATHGQVGFIGHERVDGVLTVEEAVAYFQNAS